MTGIVRTTRNSPIPLLWAAVSICSGVVLHSLVVQSMFQTRLSASFFMSDVTWRQLVSSVNGQISADLQTANVEWLPFLVVFSLMAIVTWPLGAVWISRRRKIPYRQAVADWGFLGWNWWLLAGLWEILWVTAFSFGLESLQSILMATPHLFEAFILAGWLATFGSMLATGTTADDNEVPAISNSKRIPLAVWSMIGVFVLVFTAMNWQLYEGLRVPHGDSAMYEEHLWNLTHGKGFRSYLDQGLFLGEHIQVVHLLLIPLHVIWPSHRLLELCESLALASAAIPIFWIARRHVCSARAATLLAGAYLLYFPMQFLDIAIDLKTFRPISFGVPALLFAIDQLERRHFGRAIVLMLITLSAKEDYALVVAPLGLWIAFDAWRARTDAEFDATQRRRRIVFGSGVALSATLYLLAVVFVVLPWFRGGDDPHFYRYFGELGNSPGDIVQTAFESPLLVLGRLFSLRSLIYGLLLLLPIGFLPLLSLGRLAVCLPLFAVLCLLQLSVDQPNELLIPFHHFHAPLVPIVFWAAAVGLGNVSRVASWVAARCVRSTKAQNPQRGIMFSASFCFASALTTGALIGMTPLSAKFWDSGRVVYWRELYIPGKRADVFPRVLEQIPNDARVASTDFVHPQFTHFERSYDYSHYLRKISDYESKVPDDTDYIVIDTQHKYSTIKKPSDVRELRDQPDQWEMLPDKTGGYFIILKRKQE